MILWLLALGWNDLNVESHFAFCYLLPPAAMWAWVWIPQAEVDRVREEGPIEAGNGGNGDGKDSKDGKGKDGKDSKAKKNEKPGSGSGSKVTHGYDYDYDCDPSDASVARSGARKRSRWMTKLSPSPMISAAIGPPRFFGEGLSNEQAVASSTVTRRSEVQKRSALRSCERPWQPKVQFLAQSAFSRPGLLQ